MEHYVALDVSLREISVCVMDGKGAVLFEGKTPADPAALVALIRAKHRTSCGSVWRPAPPRLGCFTP